MTMTLGRLLAAGFILWFMSSSARAECEGVCPETSYPLASAASTEWVRDNSHAGETYVYSPLKEAPIAPIDLSAKVDHFGTYYVWLKLIAPSDGANSFYAAAARQDAAQTFIRHDVAWHKDPQWYRVATIRNVPLGASVRVAFKPLEQGTRLGKVIITSQPYFTPTADELPTVANALPKENPITDAPPFAALPVASPRLLLGGAGTLDRLRAARSLADAVHTPDLPITAGKDRDRQLMEAAWWRMKNDLTLRPSDSPIPPYDCATYSHRIQAKALHYALDPTLVRWGQRAISMMSEYLDVCGYALDAEGNQVQLDSRALGEMIMLSALVYDWCNKEMTAADKQRFILRFIERASLMETDFPHYKSGVIVGHEAENLFLRDHLSAAIAFHDCAPRIYEIVAAKLFRDYVPVRNQLFQSGGLYQGTSYGPGRLVSDLFAASIYQRMLGEDLFTAPLSRQLYQAIAMRRPDGQLMRDGDTYESEYTLVGMYWFQPMPYLLAASYYGDGALKREYVLQTTDLKAFFPQKGNEQPKRPFDDLWLILFNDLALEPDISGPAGQLTTFYDAPAGYMVARTGWLAPAEHINFDSNAVVATMKVGHTNFGNHQHLDAGHFQLYYKGGLAISSGIYTGKTDGKLAAYDSPHYNNYYKRTIAHNAVLVEQADETFKGYVNDGGQRFPLDTPRTFADLDSADLRIGGAIRHSTGPATAAGGQPQAPDYSYLKGNLHDAYSAKVTNYQREFVFLNLKRPDVPAALIVFDRIQAAQASNRKAWLLHSMTEPEVDCKGKTITIRRTGNGYNGKLVNKTLLPEAVDCKAVAGFAVQGTTFPIAPTYEDRNSEEAGTWRVEVSPQGRVSQDRMLNVMQVMDATSSAQVPVQLLAAGSDRESFVGLQVENHIVFFGRDHGDIAADASFSVPGADADRSVLITDLAPGTWEVTKSGALQPTSHLVKDEEGVIYFPALASGAYRLSRKSD